MVGLGWVGLGWSEHLHSGICILLMSLFELLWMDGWMMAMLIDRSDLSNSRKNENVMIEDISKYHLLCLNSGVSIAIKRR